MILKIHDHDWVDSTNAVATDLARAGAPEGTVVVARGQRKGRGRWGRSWESPYGENLYASMVLRPHVVPPQVMGLTPAVGLATVSMLTEDLAIPAQVKWPNDIWQGKKLGGILTELTTRGEHVDFVIVGIGLNVQTTRFPSDIVATSLKQLTGKDWDIREVLNAWCRHMDAMIREFAIDGFGGMQAEYEAVMAMKGERVRVKGLTESHEGVVLGVDSVGRLRLEEKGQAIMLDSGEVEKLCSLP